MNSEEQLTIYSIGARDMLASVFALIRNKGEKEALIELAKMYKDKFGENPHIENYLKGHNG
jgi:hypothetical protein